MSRSLLRRAAALSSAVGAALVISACGGSSSADPHTGTTAQTGLQIFSTAGCASCHTLAAAKSHGDVGPNLDQLEPAYATVLKQVTNGGGGMPAFSDQLSKAQIAKVARFVADATHGS